MRFVLLALAFVLLAPLSQAAPVPKEILKKFPDYYPLLPGTEWEYRVGESAVTVKVKDYTEKAGVRTGILASEVNGAEVATEAIRVDETGVYRTHINGIKIEPAVLILKFGIQKETEWASKCQVGEHKVDFLFKLDGLEEIEVPAGKYKAVKVIGSGTIAGTETQTEFYFAEGIGIVRLTYSIGGQRTSLNLKKYTTGKAEKK